MCSQIRGVAADGDRVYIVAGLGTVRAIDATNPSRLSLIGYFQLPPGIVWSVRTTHDQVYVAQQETGLWILRPVVP